MGTRDRHGRGLRAPLLPPTLPGYRTRHQAFDELVMAAAERLEPRWGPHWGRIEFAVEEVPPSAPAAWEGGVPLGRLFPEDAGQPARLVLYRRPIEDRAATPGDLSGLVRDIVAEHVAHVLGRSPHDVDPDYGA